MSPLDELIELLRADPDASPRELALALVARNAPGDRFEAFCLDLLDALEAALSAAPIKSRPGPVHAPAGPELAPPQLAPGPVGDRAAGPGELVAVPPTPHPAGRG